MDSAGIEINRYIERIINGDVSAYDDMVRLTMKRLKAIALSHRFNNEDAEDIVSETYVSFIRKLPLFKKGTNGYGWLYTICRNICIDTIRKRKKDKVTIRPVDDLRLNDDPFNRLEMQDEVQQILSILSDEERDIVIERFWSGLKIREIAKNRGISLATYKRRLAAVMEKLKNQEFEKCF